MLPPSRERAVCFEKKVACVARFERACSYPDVRRLFSGSWSGTGADCHLNWATETAGCLSSNAKDRAPLACPRMRMEYVDTLF